MLVYKTQLQKAVKVNRIRAVGRIIWNDVSQHILSLISLHLWIAVTTNNYLEILNINKVSEFFFILCGFLFGKSWICI